MYATIFKTSSGNCSPEVTVQWSEENIEVATMKEKTKHRNHLKGILFNVRSQQSKKCFPLNLSGKVGLIKY